MNQKFSLFALNEGIIVPMQCFFMNQSLFILFDKLKEFVRRS